MAEVQLLLFVLLLSGVVAGLIDLYLGIPQFLTLLAIAFSAKMFGLLEPLHHAPGIVHAVLGLVVAILVFEGAFRLDIDDMPGSRISYSLRSLVTSTPFVTTGLTIILFLAVGIGLSAVLDLGERTSELAVITALLMVPTAPTVSEGFFDDVIVNNRYENHVRTEGILNDVFTEIGAITLFVYFFHEARVSGGLLGVLPSALLFLLIALTLGVIVGLLATYLMSGRDAELQRFVALGAIFAAYGSGFWISPSFFGSIAASEVGVVTTAFCGVVMANAEQFSPQFAIGEKEGIREFEEGIAAVLIGFVFISLVAFASFADLPTLSSYAVAGFALIGVYYLGKFVILEMAQNVGDVGGNRALFGDYDGTLFMTLVAPKGIIAAALATLLTVSLVERGVGVASFVATVTTIVIGITTLIAWFTQSLVSGGLSERIDNWSAVASSTIPFYQKGSFIEFLTQKFKYNFGVVPSSMITIVGAGDTGFGIALELAKDFENQRGEETIYMIEDDEDIVDYRRKLLDNPEDPPVSPNDDVTPYDTSEIEETNIDIEQGSGINAEMLEGIGPDESRGTDVSVDEDGEKKIFIAATDRDDKNLLSCLLAGEKGYSQFYIRVNDSSNEDIIDRLDIEIGGSGEDTNLIDFTTFRPSDKSAVWVADVIDHPRIRDWLDTLREETGGSSHAKEIEIESDIGGDHCIRDLFDHFEHASKIAIPLVKCEESEEYDADVVEDPKNDHSLLEISSLMVFGERDAVEEFADFVEEQGWRSEGKES